jgi:dihydrofolate reductase
MTRPRCSVFIAVSLDGFIAREDGGLDWLDAIGREGEDYGYAHFAASIDTIVVGRGTYDKVLGFPDWPYQGKRVVVVTHRPAPRRHDESFDAGEPAALLGRLEAAGARHVYVDGGVLIRQFLAAGLVDELTLSVVPVLLGRGIPLFGDDVPEGRLVLEESSAYGSGLVQLRYRPA